MCRIRSVVCVAVRVVSPGGDVPDRVVPGAGAVPTLVAVTTKLTVEVEEALATRVAAAAAERGVAPEALAAEVLAERFPPRRTLGFVSLGRSTSGRRAAEDEDMLAEGFGR